MRFYGLVELELWEAVDVFCTEDAALAALAACLEDEPGWQGLLAVLPLELEVSLN